MAITHPRPVFTCDCCGYETTQFNDAYVSVTLPGGTVLQFCILYSCASHFADQADTFTKNKVRNHRQLIVGGVIPDHPVA